MARERGTDRRVQKTQRSLRDALVSLIHEKSYDEIAVKEIVERAGVGRTAFYSHFGDKAALLDSGIDQMVHAAAPRQFSLRLFEHVDRFRRDPQLHMSRQGRAIVHRHLRQALIERLAADTAVIRRSRNGAEIPPDLAVEYVVNTFILVLDWWCESDSQLSPSEVDDLFLALVRPVMAVSGDSTGAR